MPVLTFPAPAVIAPGAVAHLPRSLANRKIVRPMICSDAGVAGAGVLGTVQALLAPSIDAVVFDSVPGNPTGASVQEATRLFRECGCDALIAVGGGSVMDHAKAVAAMVGSRAVRISELSLTRRPPLAISAVPPWIAIPTTAGTGSEMSPTAVILEDGAKHVIGSRVLLPTIALCDPDLTATVPAHLAAATAMDALAHCIEAVLAPADNPPADLIGLDGIRRIVRARAAVRACSDPADVEARTQLLLASCEGALAFTKGLGAVHTLSHACGAQLAGRLHHGTLNAIFLPVVVRFNASARPAAAAQVAEAMGLTEPAGVPAALARLVRELRLPDSLAAIGLDESAADRVAELAQHDICVATNPRPLDFTAHRELFVQALRPFA